MKYLDEYNKRFQPLSVDPNYNTKTAHEVMFNAIDEIITRLDRIENRTKPQAVVPPDAGPDDELDTSQFGD